MRAKSLSFMGEIKLQSRAFAKLIAFLASIFTIITLMTGCSAKPEGFDELTVTPNGSGLKVSLWAKNSELNDPELYSGVVQFGTFEYELSQKYSSKKEKDGLKKIYFLLGSGEIINGTRQSTEDFDEITISIFVANKRGGEESPYLKTVFAVPQKAPSFDAGYFIQDQPWTDKIHVDFYVGNPWHFPESYTCGLVGDLEVSTTVQLSELPVEIFEDNRPLPCRLTYSGSDGMKVSVAISANNAYGKSPIFMSEQYTLTTFVSKFVPEQPACPGPLSITELQAKPGDCGTFDVEVFQADLMTGACSFLGNWPQSNGDTAVGLFHFCDVYGEGVFAEGSTYTVSAEVRGTTSYEAQIGGSRTVVEFDLVK